MKLSTKSRYGLRAMLEIALQSGEEPVSIRYIAERQNISEAYLEQLMAKLKKTGLIESHRGSQGGYVLARDASLITVGDVLRSLEGSLEAATCPGMEGDGSCEGSDVCVTKVVWKRINEGIAQAVDSMTLSQLAQESRKARQESA